MEWLNSPQHQCTAEWSPTQTDSTASCAETVVISFLKKLEFIKIF